MIKGLVLSIQFLTSIPINVDVEFNNKNIARSVAFFPLVGLGIGLVGGGIYLIFSKINSDIGSFFALLSTIISTGGLHLDGLADTFDGFLSNRDKDRSLEIMSDSNIGAFGAISIVLALLLKYILISNFKKNLPLILGLTFANSRLVIAYIQSFKKLAKTQGLAYRFYKSKPKKFMFLGLWTYVLFLIILNKTYLIPLLSVFLLGEIMDRISLKKIGGFTGDVHGATMEIGEIVSLFSFLILDWIN